MEQLRLSVDRLSSENKQLKTSSFQAPQLEPELLEALQTLHGPPATVGQHASRSLSMRHSGDVLCSETESNLAPKRSVVGGERNTTSISQQERRRRSSADAALKQAISISPPSSGADYDSVGGSDASPCYPDNLILKTEQLTGEIHQLLGAAQAGRQDRYDDLIYLC